MPDDVRPVEDAMYSDEDMIRIGEDDPNFVDLPDEVHERIAASQEPVSIKQIIRECDEAIEQGRTIPLRQALDEIYAKYGVPR